MEQEDVREMRSLTYELFILALSEFALSNLILLVLPIDQDLRNVVIIVDTITCFFFLADFFYRLNSVPDRRHYLIRGGGWLDLIGSLPFPLFRIARIVRVFRVSGWLRGYGVRGLWREVRAERAASALYLVLLVALVVVEYVSMAELIVS